MRQCCRDRNANISGNFSYLSHSVACLFVSTPGCFSNRLIGVALFVDKFVGLYSGWSFPVHWIE